MFNFTSNQGNANENFIDFGKVFISGNIKWWQEYGIIVLSYTTALKSSLTTFIRIFIAFFSFCPAIPCPRCLFWHIQTHAQRYVCTYEMSVNETESCVCLEVNIT